MSERTEQGDAALEGHVQELVERLRAWVDGYVDGYSAVSDLGLMHSGWEADTQD